MSELLGVILVVYFMRLFAGQHQRPIPAVIVAAAEVPTILVLIGVVCMGAALVAEMVKVSAGVAIVMGGSLVFVVGFCALSPIALGQATDSREEH